ncbi:T9SS type A sorting domain-containing protein, partial [Fulvivirga sp. RKSG066]|uniref:T9SS type A sorting domain-containing protein n=1 Tax=Fulvivirga aurantia TaxID=2529383 RepID=UPI0012BBE903
MKKIFTYLGLTLLSIVALQPMALGQSCPSPYVIDWDTYAGTDPRSQNYTADDVEVSIESVDLYGHVSDFSVSNAIQNTYSIYWEQNIDNNNEFALATFKFSKPTKDFAFTIFDVDAGAWVDSLTVNGYSDGSLVSLIASNVTTSVANSYVGNNTVVGNATVNNATSTDGNVTYLIPETIDSLVFVYNNHTAPSGQVIGIHDFSWCGSDSDYDQVLNVDDADDDNDGIPDIQEGLGFDPGADEDGDGTPDYADADYSGFTDSNLDGISDNFDADLDGIPNHLDRDSDNDGIPDAVEANGGVLPANMSADGRYSTAYAMANDADGDGIVDALDTDNGGTPLANTNTDGDALPDIFDRDSDGDGIPDIEEVGGVDADFDGMVDGFTDKDNDGVHDTYDINAGGNALVIANLDADALPNYRDIDSDKDGILDNVEAQNSLLFRAATGLDSDNDGIDDAYDVDNTGAIVFQDTDGDGKFDFVDGDSDGDGVRDFIEGHDPDSNGIANTPQSNTDTDGDGLADSFDTDNGGTAAALQNTDGDSRPDWRDTDDDNDGIPTVNEDFNGDRDNANDFTQGGGSTPDYLYATKDLDGDGLLNSVDTDDNNDGIPDSEQASCSVASGNAVSQTNSGVGGAANSLGAPDGSSAQVRNGDVLTLDLNRVVPEGITIALRMAKIQTGGADAGVTVSQSIDGTNFTNAFDIVLASNTLADYNFTLTADAQYIRIERLARGNFVDAVSYSFDDCIDSDLDGDGIVDRLDLDSDGDGIPNAVEANGGTLPANMNENGQYSNAYAAANDSDGDGLVNNVDPTTGGTPLVSDFDGDGVPDFLDQDADNDGIPDFYEAGATDSNGDGTNDTYSNIDGDALPDYLDADSDGDGIRDLVEGQTTAGFTTPSGVDTDGDGIDNSFDSDNGGTDIIPLDFDNDGTPDFQDTDSDNDTVLDLVEGHDANSNGTADRNPSGADTDGDGLDNRFDTDNGGTTAPIQNTDGADDVDFRDTDDDNDTVPTKDETADIDPANGTADYLEATTNPCGNGVQESVVGNASSIVFNPNNRVANAANMVGVPNNGFATFNNNGGLNDFAILDLQEFIPAGETIAIRALTQNGNEFTVATGTEINGTTINLSGNTNFSDNFGGYAWTIYNYIVPAEGARYVYLARVAGEFGIDAFSYSFTRCLTDTDNDGIADNVDQDDDNDGIPDATEIASYGADPSADEDNDNIPNYLDTDFAGFVDSNLDGVDDNADYDKDGIPNHLDLDSDNDGIVDAVEANAGVLPNNMTADGRYTGSYVKSNDTDNDGLANAVETTPLSNPDSDMDGLNDMFDRDSDNDGITDVVEAGGVDVDGNGVLDNFTDSDGDGLANSVDPDNGGSPMPLPNSDSNGLKDYIDIDSDDDGILDMVEGNDANEDGVAEWDANGNGVLDTGEGAGDADNDGILDAFDRDAGGVVAALPDTDGNGAANYRDADDDGDGEPTVTEDSNSNGNFTDDFTSGQANGSTPDYLYNQFTALPVELISFTAELTDKNTVALTWETASEINNDRFEIEHSLDGIDFVKIGQVDGNGTTRELSVYEFEHKKPAAGMRNYYRLKQVDYDGEFEYSDVIAVQGKVEVAQFVELRLFPNPATEFINLSLTDYNGPISYQVINISGHVMIMGSTEGENQLKVDVSALETGMYVVKVKGGDHTQIKRFIK